MENASKALIIAGAILLSILLISLGLVVYNTASSTINNVNLSEQEIQTFNSKFMTYVGNNQTAAQVNALLQQAIATNQSAINSENGQYIYIYNTEVKEEKLMVGEKSGELVTAETRVTTASSYSVTIPASDGYSTAGTISKIIVKANS